MISRFIFSAVFAFLHIAFIFGQSVSNLRCENVVNPIGIETVTPKLSWIISSPSRGEVQTAWQVLVATSPDLLNEEKADLWNSRKVGTDQSVNVPYRGKTLLSRNRCFWKVRIWDSQGKATGWSETAVWEMGLLSPSDWKGKWISAVPQSDTTAPVMPAPFFRTEFNVRSGVKSARLYISGLGYYEAFLNGKKIGNHVLDPAFTRYDRSVKYVVHDITSLLRNSSVNAIGVVLGNGWYNQHSRTAWDFDRAPWRDAPVILAQAEMTYEDGRTEIIATGSDWKFSSGPITFNDVHNGEHYDARLELQAWDQPGYYDSPWTSAFEKNGPSGRLSAQLMPPIRVVKKLTPVKTRQVGNKVVYDIGQNISGWIRIMVTGPAGAQVTLRHGERINEDGSLDIKELSRFIWTGEVQTDSYTLKGGAMEIWSPRFTYHGFQYVEVMVSSPELKIVELEAEVVHTDFVQRGTFTSSEPLFNKIHENLKWSYLTNYHGYPTDCPHREKMGWTGDAHLISESGLFNFAVEAAYIKWLDDFVDEQLPTGQLPGIIPSSGWGYSLGKTEARVRGHGPQWEGALLLICRDLYLYTGDSSIVTKYYPAMQAYVDYLSSHSVDNLIGFGIDDHKQIRPVTGPEFLSAEYYYFLTDLLSDMSAIAGKREEEKKYRTLAGSIKKAFNDHYFDAETGVYGRGGQAQAAGPLHLGLVEENQRKRVMENLIKAVEDNKGHIETGVVGTKHLIHALMEGGQDRVLYEMASKKDFPGWGYWIELGATTLFQNWDGSQSRNHIMFGTIGDYFYQGLGGIKPDPDNPGFKNFFIEPLLNNDLNEVSVSFRGPFGQIAVQWQKQDTDLKVVATVPVNTNARLVLPGFPLEKISVDGKNIQRVKGFLTGLAGKEKTTIVLGSGTYEIRIKNVL